MSFSSVACRSSSGPSPADPAFQTNADVQAMGAEQAALRPVASLAARAVSNERLFAAVSQELARLVGVDAAAVLRFELDETITLLAGCTAADVLVAVGDQQPVNAALRRLRDSARPIRCGPADVPLTGPFIAEMRRLGIRSTVAVPIQADGRVWGVVVAASQSPEPFPPATEARMLGFAELVARAVRNAQSPVGLAASRARTEQVRSEVRWLAGVLLDDVERIAECSVARMQKRLPSYAKVPPEKLIPVTLTNTRNLLEAIRDPEADPVRAENQFRVLGETRVSQGIAADEMLQAWRIGLEVVREEAHPVARQLGIADDVLLDFVEATLQWGDVGMRESASAYRETEIRELHRLAEEQAALRRVATLVARGAPPEEVFATVTREVGQLLKVEIAILVRYEDDDTASFLRAWRKTGDSDVPDRTRLGGNNPTTTIARTGRPARIDGYRDFSGPVGEFANRLGARSSVGTPVSIEDRLWGAMIVASNTDEPLPANTETRLADFTALVAMAIANAESRAELIASRARIVAAADESRRRIERDLHDGAQQRLVHAVIVQQLALRALENGDANVAELMSEALQHAQQANSELGELAHGILPSVLTREGLRAGVEALVSRSSLPVGVDMPIERLPAGVEATAYFVVSEALTNVVKHAHAGGATVAVRVEDGMLRVDVRDDGVGGARATDNSGLHGLEDRVSALDGRLIVESHPGQGTLVSALLPVPEED